MACIAIGELLTISTAPDFTKIAFLECKEPCTPTILKMNIWRKTVIESLKNQEHKQYVKVEYKKKNFYHAFKSIEFIQRQTCEKCGCVYSSEEDTVCPFSHPDNELSRVFVWSLFAVFWTDSERQLKYSRGIKLGLRPLFDDPLDLTYFTTVYSNNPAYSQLKQLKDEGVLLHKTIKLYAVQEAEKVDIERGVSNLKFIFAKVDNGEDKAGIEPTPGPSRAQLPGPTNGSTPTESPVSDSVQSQKAKRIRRI